MIYITGDLHGTAEYGRNRLLARCWPEGRGPTRDDIEIVAGDFGYVWCFSEEECGEIARLDLA